MNQFTPKKNRDHQPDVYRRILEDICHLSAEFDTEIKAYRKDKPLGFTPLNEEAQDQVIAKALRFRSILQSSLKLRGQEDSNQVLLWHALKELGLKPCSSFFSYLKEDSVVEIHNFDGVQIFCNLNFFNYCSYTLDELFCIPWHEIFDHSGHTEELLSFLGDIRTGQIKKTTKVQVKPHTITEISSPRRLKIDATVEYGGPLFDEHRQAVATIVIEKGKIISSG